MLRRLYTMRDGGFLQRQGRRRLACARSLALSFAELLRNGRYFLKTGQVALFRARRHRARRYMPSLVLRLLLHL